MLNIAFSNLQLPESVPCLRARSSVAETYQRQAQSEITYDNLYHLLQLPKRVLSNPPSSTSSTSKSRIALGKKLVSTTAQYLDHLSFMDATFPLLHDGMLPMGCHSNQGWWQANFKASMLDLQGNEDDDRGHHENVLQAKIRSSVEVLSFGSCRRKYEKLLKEVDLSGAEASHQESENELSSNKRDQEEVTGKEGEEILPCIENVDTTLKVRAQETKW